MDEKTTYWAAIGLGAGALLLLIINIFTISNNQRLQIEVSQRAGVINSAATFDQIDKGIIQALGTIAIEKNDTEARNLLAGQGITIPPAAKAEEPKDAKKKADKSEKSDD